VEEKPRQALLQLLRASVHRSAMATEPDVRAGPIAVVVPSPGRGGIDRRIFAAINGLPHSTTSDRYVTTLSNLGEGLGWVAGGAAIAVLGGRKGRRAGLATALASVTATYVVQKWVKPVFRRARPAARGARVVGLRPIDHSFPSGHSASSFAAATALSIYYPKAAPIAFTLAGGVGLSRVHLGVHYPSDAAVGAAIGIGIGTLVGWLVTKGPIR
jgi:membrane-associated phospholipid phosphatase